MTSSPKKYASNFTSSTTNRGVEAKETEITNIHLDMNTSNSTQLRDERSRDSEPGAAHDDTATGSYIQFAGGGAEAQRRRRRAARGARLQPAPPRRAHARAGTGGRGRRARRRNYCGRVRRGRRAGAAAAGELHARRRRRHRPRARAAKKQRVSSWRKFGGFGGESPDSDDNEPECVEVYYFERSGGEYLATGEADRARLTALDRAARRCARRGGALLAELLAAPRLLVALPVGVLLAVERCALVTARGALAGGVQTLADYCTKPALALAFNALVHPPLVFVGNALRAAREALRPLWLALGDALEPAARLVAAVRPVHVQLAPCRCRAEPARRP